MLLKEDLDNIHTRAGGAGFTCGVERGETMIKYLAPGCYLILGQVEAFESMNDHILRTEHLREDALLCGRAVRAWAREACNVPPKEACIITLSDEGASHDNKMTITKLL